MMAIIYPVFCWLVYCASPIYLWECGFYSNSTYGLIRYYQPYFHVPWSSMIHVDICSPPGLPLCASAWMALPSSDGDSLTWAEEPNWMCATNGLIKDQAQFIWLVIPIPCPSTQSAGSHRDPPSSLVRLSKLLEHNVNILHSTLCADLQVKWKQEQLIPEALNTNYRSDRETTKLASFCPCFLFFLCSKLNWFYSLMAILSLRYIPLLSAFVTLRSYTAFLSNCRQYNTDLLSPNICSGFKMSIPYLISVKPSLTLSSTHWTAPVPSVIELKTYRI